MSYGRIGRLRVMLIERSVISMRQLRQLFTELLDCDVLIYDNTRDALVNIPPSPPDLIVTEWDQDDICGEELIRTLRQSRELQRIPVFVCTSSRQKDLVQAVGQYPDTDLFHKPINSFALRRRLAELFGPAATPEKVRVSFKSDSDLKSRLKHIDKLAPLPALVGTILQITGDANSSARTLAEAVQVDQSLTAKILQIVNSAYYGFYREIGNIDHAVVILGFDEITNITLAVCLIQTYGDHENHFYKQDQFWLHSLGVAYIARELRSFVPGVISKDAFVIGLLHDLGKLVLHQHFRDGFIAALEMAREEKRPLHEACKEVLGFDHADVGGMIAQNWNLPVPLVKAIAYHHTPSIAQSQDYSVHLAHLANYFAHRQGIGDSGNPVYGEPDPTSLKVFGFENQDIDAVWTSLKIDLKALEGVFRTFTGKD